MDDVELILNELFCKDIVSLILPYVDLFACKKQMNIVFKELKKCIKLKTTAVVIKIPGKINWLLHLVDKGHIYESERNQANREMMMRRIWLFGENWEEVLR